MPRSPASAAFAVLVAAFAAPAFAQTATAQSGQSAMPGYGVSTPGAAHAPASPEVVAARKGAREACAADVAKLCPDVQPGGGAVMKCVRQHRAELSPGCGEALHALRDARRAEKG